MSTLSQPIALTPSTAGFSSTFPSEFRLSSEKTRLPLRERVSHFCQSNLGLGYIILAQIFGTCMNVTVKLLNTIDPPVPTFEIIFIRMSITFCFSVAVMYATKVPHPIAGPPAVRHLLAVRGFCGFFGLFGIYYSLVYLSLSDAIVITFLVPTTVAIAGYLLLNESLSRKEIVAGGLSFVGVVLIARPEFLFGPQPIGIVPIDGHAAPAAEKGTPTQRLIAVGVALLGVLGGTGALISIRAIGKRAHHLHSISYFSLWCCLVSTVAMVALKTPIVIPEKFMFVVLMFAIGIFGFATQVYLTMGLQRETASRGSLGLYTQILFAASAERWIFHVIPSYLSMMGTVVIMACAIYIVLNKSPQPREAESPEERRHALPLVRDSLEEEPDTELHGLMSGIRRERTPDLEQRSLPEQYASQS